ncbi:sigma-54-dependent Fis family transcriptional regulator [PVC group bacterium]|nr:sigma-54-dependent Fis family transcriptional regulator [PVC group bacterium]
MHKNKILIVDDDLIIRKSLAAMLNEENYETQVAADSHEALEHLKNTQIDLILSDISMPGMSGIDLLKEVKKFHSHVIVILITGYGTIENAVESIKYGAYDYITKPLLDEQVKVVIQRSLEQQALKNENEKLKEQILQISESGDSLLLGQDYKFQKILELVHTVADSNATILITGESGTGKSMIARSIHKFSGRASQPFVEVSCGMLSETLLESELFGHVKGSFTGALNDKLGKFSMADKGTIFLDEIAVASPALQLKLLRVLQDQKFESVGGTETIEVDTRVVAATNHDLQKEVHENRFRKDLFYRLNVISIHIPPLRERITDVKILAHHFLEKFCKQNNKDIHEFSPDAMTELHNYTWPGNIRELENVVERAVVLCKEKIITQSYLSIVKETNLTDTLLSSTDNIKSLEDSLAGPERKIIKMALDKNHWNRQGTAHMLGINRTTLFHKMKKYNLHKNQGDI